jgi:hypothetical protein
VETVAVLGYEHVIHCLVARYAAQLEAGWRGDPDGFPWCTCSHFVIEGDLPRRVPWVMRGPWEF